MSIFFVCTSILSKLFYKDIHIYKQDLALNNLQVLICHKTELKFGDMGVYPFLKVLVQKWDLEFELIMMWQFRMLAPPLCPWDSLSYLGKNVSIQTHTHTHLYI